ncbi:hypothetical protein Q4610_13675 [Sphingobium sp. HBC34]|uniref:Uncharacterized protein n=1 Tax=Sphingobium cyanobacteriorum TaxID=3063954 RepID=A0ABT8ZQV1_9SPHN|nr:hypothetical protein [Sphingobium sp. HBC34]MDO7836095.1 hypothetical protein [Sphingobium sp. HBC34]
MMLLDDGTHRFQHAGVLLFGAYVFEAPIKWGERSLKEHEGKAPCRGRDSQHKVRIRFSWHRFDILGVRLLLALDGAFQDAFKQHFLLFGSGAVVMFQLLEHHIGTAGNAIFHLGVEVGENMMGRITKQHFAGDGYSEARRTFSPLNARDHRAAPTSEQAGEFGLRETPCSPLAPQPIRERAFPVSFVGHICFFGQRLEWLPVSLFFPIPFVPPRG